MGLKRIILYCQLFGLVGLWYWFASKTGLIRKPRLAVASTAVLKFPFYLRLNSSDIKVFQHVVLEDEYHVNLLRQPRVIVDAGANIGLSSLVFANKYPMSRVFAIEPERSNFEVLCKNVAPYPNIIPIQAALWSCETEIFLIDPGLDKWGFQVSGHMTPSAVVERVNAITIDSLMVQHHIDAIDVLKIDIEGAEKEVFDASTAWIDTVALIIVELHDRIKHGCRQSLEQATAAFSIRKSIGDCNWLLARKGQMKTE